MVRFQTHLVEAIVERHSLGVSKLIKQLELLKAKLEVIVGVFSIRVDSLPSKDGLFFWSPSYIHRAAARSQREQIGLALSHLRLDWRHRVQVATSLACTMFVSLGCDSGC
jgi:hypothetical protein